MMRFAAASTCVCLAAALCGPAAVLALAALGGCGPGATPAPNPNAGFLRDFLDGKFDSDGHPLNGRVTQAQALCGATGSPVDGGLELAGAPCQGALAGGALPGDLVANARLRVVSHASDDIATLTLLAADGSTLTTDTLTADRVRGDGWLDLPLRWTSNGAPVSIRITPAADAVVDLAYVEVFPSRFGLIVAPGSGPITDADHLTIELPLHRELDRLEVGSRDLLPRLDDLIAAGSATETTTSFRKVIDVAVGDLLPARGDVAELQVGAGADAARVELRRTPPACNFEGDPAGAKVLITGFQPFPADASHDNVSAVAVTALDPSVLHGARVMRLVLPVEYDRAAAEVKDAIARCQPDAVLSFGQGGYAIALEEVAYNLQDTSEVPGGVPDNRGVIRAAMPIDPSAPATRDTRLPLDAIDQALQALGEQPAYSRDPGRYVCNNVMFAELGAAAGRPAGFIHLPYTARFDDTVRARYARVVAAAIDATVAQL